MKEMDPYGNYVISDQNKDVRRGSLVSEKRLKIFELRDCAFYDGTELNSKIISVL